MTFKEFFSFRKNTLLWGNLLAVLILGCLLIVGVWFGLSEYTQHGKSVEIPTVRGLERQDAFNLIQSRGLKVEISGYTHVKGLSAEEVVEQNPAPGARVKSGRVVYLTINSLTVPTVQLPDVANNSSLRQAAAKLISAGFRLNEEEYIDGDRDWVYSLKMNGRILKEGEAVPVGATLTLVVGNGRFESVAHDSMMEYTADPFSDIDMSEFSNPEEEKPVQEEPHSTTPSGNTHEDSWF